MKHSCIMFSEWLMREQTKKTRLCVMDFDGTVANVPERPTGGDLRNWNGRDWWGSKASLTHPDEGGFFDGNMNQEVIDAFKSAQADPNTHTILLTGRRSPAATYVRRVLQKHNLHGRRVVDDALPEVVKRHRQEIASGNDVVAPDESGHEQYFTGDHKVSNGISGTFGHKKHVIDKLVYGNGGYDTIDIWDDRKDHIDLFKSLAADYFKNGLVKHFNIHQVFGPTVEGGIATVIHFPVKH